MVSHGDNRTSVHVSRLRVKRRNIIPTVLEAASLSCAIPSLPMTSFLLSDILNLLVGHLLALLALNLKGC